MKNINMKNYLKIEVGSRGEIEEVKWFNDKTFEEIVEIGKKEFEDNKVHLLSECEDEEERLSKLKYIEEFCAFEVKEDAVVEMSKHEELGCGYYREDLVKELIGLDLENEDDDLIGEVIGRVGGVLIPPVYSW